MAGVDLGSGIGAGLQAYVAERDYQQKIKFEQQLEQRKIQDEEKWKQQDQEYRLREQQLEHATQHMQIDATKGTGTIVTRGPSGEVISSYDATPEEVTAAQTGAKQAQANVAKTQSEAGLQSAVAEKTGYEAQSTAAAVPYAGQSAAANVAKEQAYADMLTGRGTYYRDTNPTKITVQAMKNQKGAPNTTNPDDYISSLIKDPAVSKVYKEYTDPNGEYALGADDAQAAMKAAITQAAMQAKQTGKPVDPRTLIPQALKKKALEIQKIPTLPAPSGQ